jgi:diguanylate cyclase (GGDEF)-like protein
MTEMPVRTLLVIDDDALDRKAVARALAVLGSRYEMREARDGRKGVELATAQPFDCILLDLNLPDMSGLDLLVELRARLGTAVPIVMLTGSGNEATAVEAMKRGAHDYLPKAQLEPQALLRVVSNAIEKSALQEKLAVSQQKLERLALYDALTGLGNRNLFHIELARAIAVSRRKETSFVVLMMDLDKFKAANDTFGHEAGDAILAEVGRRLRNVARAADAYFRLGGDEFTAILDAGSDGAAAARRIVAAIAEPVLFGPHVLTVEISIGLAAYPADGASAQDLTRVADAAMYAVKCSGAPWTRTANVAAE